MFTPPRFVVIDDNEQHLDAIVRAVQTLGSACARVHYQIEHDVPLEPFRGVRMLFVDLQLLDRTLTADFSRHFAEIQRILGNVINPDGGPFILVVWTDKPEQVTELNSYLERFFVENPHARPAALVPLSKTDYIDLDTGALLGSDHELRDAVLKRLNENPAMASLVQWEVDILDAASRVLADVVKLSAGTVAGPTALPTLLKRLATEAVGHTTALDDPRASLHAALLPLLQDHVQNATGQPQTQDSWPRAFESAPETLPKLTKAQVSHLNTMLHITQQSTSAPISPSAWGAICELEEGLDWAEFGHTNSEEYLREVVQKNLKIDWSMYKDGVKLVQIRIGAACDYAQKADGPVPYALAAVIPERVESKPHTLNPNSGCWLSPVVEVGTYGPVQLIVEPRFVRVRGAQVADQFEVVARIKEQLLLELVAVVSHHSSRPGIVRFVADN